MCAFSATLTASAESHAQQAPTRPPDWALEQQTREGWLHGAQQPRFESFLTHRGWLLVDSIRGNPSDRTVYLTLGRTAFGRDSAAIVSDATGHVLRVDAGYAPSKRFGMMSPDDSARMEESRRVTLDGRMMLADARVWDFVITFPSAPRIGARWTDTIARVAKDGPSRQAMSGRIVSRIVGDTSIGGHRYWIVRDSSNVTYEERRPERERTLDTLVLVSRTVSGFVRGALLYDAGARLLTFRDDTMNLSGEAVLRYPDGRTFRTPTRYERIRRWQLHDSTQYVARRAAIRMEAENSMGGMVFIPGSDLERRLARNDLALRDSLMTVLQRTSNADEMLSVFGMLSMWAGRDTAFRRRIDSVRFARGDTAYLYERLTNRAYSRYPPTSALDVRAMLPFMEDPGKAWSLNASRDWLYENLVQAMTQWPRAAASGRDTAYVACTLEACRLLGDVRLTAREPRLRDVALVALFSMDPATWGDTILRLAGRDHPLLRSAANLARGVGATWPAASKAPIPPADSDWRTWLRWMDGRDTAYTRAQLALRPQRRLPLDTTPHPRFEESHRTAIRMLMLRTGRDIVGELRRGYERAVDDTARLVFGTMLQGLDALDLTETQIADAFASGVSIRASLARHAMMKGFAESGVAMPEPDASPLVDRLLLIIVDSAALWPIGAPDMMALHRPGPELHAARGHVRINASNLPASLKEKWGGRVEIVAPNEPHGDRADLREAAVIYTISPVVRFGRFVRLEINASEQVHRAENQSPMLFAAGTTFYLMNRGGEWVIVGWDSWVT